MDWGVCRKIAVVVMGSFNLGSGHFPLYSQPSACQVKLCVISVSWKNGGCDFEFLFFSVKIKTYCASVSLQCV